MGTRDMITSGLAMMLDKVESGRSNDALEVLWDLQKQLAVFIMEEPIKWAPDQPDDPKTAASALANRLLAAKLALQHFNEREKAVALVREAIGSWRKAGDGVTENG